MNVPLICRGNKKVTDAGKAADAGKMTVVGKAANAKVIDQY